MRFYGAFSHDVTAAIVVFQTNPMGIELFSNINAFFVPIHFCIDAGHVSENAL